MIIDISNYDLGIVWALGSKIEQSKFSFRHKEKYFIERLSLVFGNNVYSQKRVKDKSDVQFVLKPKLNADELYSLGWSARNSEERELPILSDYKDFLRAYLEVHSSLDYSSRRRRSGGQYKSLRLRIYGNANIIAGINQIFSQEINVAIKKIQVLKNQKTAILYYHSLAEIQEIFDYIKGQPNFLKFWENVNEKLENPVID